MNKVNSDIAFKRIFGGCFQVEIDGEPVAQMTELAFAYFLVGTSTCGKSVFNMDSQQFLAGNLDQLINGVVR